LAKSSNKQKDFGEFCLVVQHAVSAQACNEIPETCPCAILRNPNFVGKQIWVGKADLRSEKWISN